MIEELPFDIYQRYRMVERIINGIRKKRKFSILDVGGYPCYISDFLPEDRTYVLDVYYSVKTNYIRGNGLNLPFKNDSFDIITTIDVLEHIPQPKRKEFMDELLRVSKNYLIVGNPFRGEDVQLSEEIANSFSILFADRENPWLSEHARNVLPALDETIDHFRDLGYQTIDFPNGYLFNWLFMIVLNQCLELSGDLWELYRRVNAIYNREFFVSDNASPSYRRVILVSKNEKLPSKLESQILGNKDSAGRSVLSSPNMTDCLFEAIEKEIRNNPGSTLKGILRWFMNYDRFCRLALSAGEERKNREVDKLKTLIEYMKVGSKEKMEMLLLKDKKIETLQRENEELQKKQKNGRRELEERIEQLLKESENGKVELEYIKSTFSYKFYSKMKKLLPFL